MKWTQPKEVSPLAPTVTRPSPTCIRVPGCILAVPDTAWLAFSGETTRLCWRTSFPVSPPNCHSLSWATIFYKSLGNPPASYSLAPLKAECLKRAVPTSDLLPASPAAMNRPCPLRAREGVMETPCCERQGQVFGLQVPVSAFTLCPGPTLVSLGWPWLVLLPVCL